MQEKKININFSKFYPLFFTVLFIILILQYSFSTFEAILYDLRVKFDFSVPYNEDIVIVTLDEESNQFLGENYPYSYATHSRLLKKILNEKPLALSYFISLQEPSSENENFEMENFRKAILEYKKNGGFFHFGTDMDSWGEQLPPKQIRDLEYALSLLNVDSATFSRDGVSRRIILESLGFETLHLKLANFARDKKGEKHLDARSISGSYYVPEAEATFVMYKFFDNPTKKSSRVHKIPYHRAVVGNFPKNFFNNKIVLIGTEYISNPSDFILTPFNKGDQDEAKSSKINVHAQIINSLIHNETVIRVPQTVTSILSIALGLLLSLAISRLQPTTGLAVTVSTLVGIILISHILFSFLGYWIYLTHIILTISIVYYIWVPFRAIDEYQTRYKIQEETKLMNKVDHLKQNFISLMSHDLKTPVAKIAGLADNLSNQFNNSDEQKHYLNRIIEATKELNRFITSILDLTKIESRNLNLKIISKDINTIIETVTKNLNYEAASKNMVIITELSPLYPIKIDVELINRVVANLVENALKYAGPGKEITVKTWDDANWVYVLFKDNGKGIAPEDQENIFQKFYRVKDDASYSVKGSGLGLYLVKYFIELHGGTITVKSELGIGTEFLVKLKNS